MLSKEHLQRALRLVTSIVVVAIFLGGSIPQSSDGIEQAYDYTRGLEFNFAEWMLDALAMKAAYAAVGAGNYIPVDEGKQLVMDYLELTGQSQSLERQLRDMYADPDVDDPDAASTPLRAELDAVQSRHKELQPIAEEIIQSQVSQVAADFGLAYGGQPVPPVLYHSTPLPYALIISPREVIRQDKDISLEPTITLDEIIALEEEVDKGLNVSSLVVPIGGVGVYPSMVERTSSLQRLVEVVSHEWVHNFLTLRPLGMRYLSSAELRIMNETAASIADKELGRAVLERFYPEAVPPPAPEPALAPPSPAEPAEEPAFDFRAAMHETRVSVDRLLAEGKVEEAEEYMEQRRVYIWNNGYHIRKLNQAYFAFYGAYADQPGGPAGEDPVGAAVRELRAASPTLADFLKRLSWMWSYEQLVEAVGS